MALRGCICFLIRRYCDPNIADELTCDANLNMGFFVFAGFKSQGQIVDACGMLELCEGFSSFIGLTAFEGYELSLGGAIAHMFDTVVCESHRLHLDRIPP